MKTMLRIAFSHFKMKISCFVKSMATAFSTREKMLKISFLIFIFFPFTLEKPSMSLR